MNCFYRNTRYICSQQRTTILRINRNEHILSRNTIYQLQITVKEILMHCLVTIIRNFKSLNSKFFYKLTAVKIVKGDLHIITNYIICSLMFIYSKYSLYYEIEKKTKQKNIELNLTCFLIVLPSAAKMNT